MQENVNNTEKSGEQVEAQAATSFGKFKDADALFSAYGNLEAEFTKKCQRIKELEENGSVQLKDENKPLYEQSDWQAKVTEFMIANPDAQTHAAEIAKMLSVDDNLAKSHDCLQKAYLKIVKETRKTPAEFMEDRKFLDEYVYKNAEIRREIVADYLKNLNRQAPDIMGKGGEIFVAPPKRPTTLTEAGQMAEKLLK